jgi:hypothetical protein
VFDYAAHEVARDLHHVAGVERRSESPLHH